LKMSRRRRQTGSEESSGNWLTTYADLVTLLFTFFVLLYTFSSIDAERFKEIAVSLQLALTGQSGSTIFDEYPGGPIGPIIPSQDIPPEDQDDARF
jgi:chemotaxis protein MotB